MRSEAEKTLNVLKDNPYLYYEERISLLESRIKRLEENRETEEQGTIKDAVVWSGMGKDFIYQKCKAEEFPHHYTEEGLLYFVKSEVKKWRAERFNR